MYNISIQHGMANVTVQEDAEFAVSGLDIKIVEPGDFEGDWLVELPHELAEKLMSEDGLDMMNGEYLIYGSADKEW